jgi:hypothetical protein
MIKSRILNWKHGLVMILATLLAGVSVLSQQKSDEQQKQERVSIAPDSGDGAPAARKAKAVRTTGNIPPEGSVLTYLGPCDPAQKNVAGKGCKVTLTRAEIDTLINTLEPTSSSSNRRQLAINYARLSAAAGAAQRQHLEKDPAIAKQIQLQQKLTRMQVLANALYSQMEAKANDVPAVDIEKYYIEHQTSFVHGDVRRLTIPKSISAADSQPVDIEALHTLAEQYRTRATAGEDIDKLQEEVIKNLGIKVTMPATKVSLARPTYLSMLERGVFDLKAGQVTEVIDSPAAFTVLKLDSKQPISLEIAKLEILPVLQRQRVQQEIRRITQITTPEFNLKYLGLPTAPDILPPPQVAGLSTEQITQSNVAQRGSLRPPLMSHKREVPAAPNTRR